MRATDELFAMAAWGVTFQSHVPGQTSSYFLAADMKNKLVDMFGVKKERKSLRHE